MGRETGIQWASATYNPWRGCSHVSEGCVNCYAEKQSKRNPRVLGEWGLNATRAFAAESYIREAFAMDKSAHADGTEARLMGKPVDRPRLFCGSLMDVWEWRHDLAESRARLFDTIAKTPNLDWLLLSKRPENWLRCIEQALPLCSPEAMNLVCGWVAAHAGLRVHSMHHQYQVFAPKVPANVWIGWTVENNRRAPDRCTAGLQIPAVCRFVSAEPLLDLPELRPYLGRELVNWVIVGGESGAKARPFDTDWARCLLDQTQDAGVSFFMKQMGDNPVGGSPLFVKGDEWEGIPADLRVRQFPVLSA